MHPAAPLRMLLLLALVVTSSGCSWMVRSQLLQAQCESDGDCDTTQVCQRNVCVDDERDLGTSCEGMCGLELDGCFCDVECLQNGDCCDDFAVACGGSDDAAQCAGRCGEPAPAGCFCDVDCVENGDCCPDYANACGDDDAGLASADGGGDADGGTTDAGTVVNDDGGAPRGDAGAPDAGTAPDDAGTAVDAGGAVDAGPSDVDPVDAGPVDAGPPTNATVVLGQGHLGRTLLSCDDGATWHHDQSLDDNAVCWLSSVPDNIECDHHVGSGTGVVFADGYAFAAWGWGTAAHIDRTTDGITWTPVWTSDSAPNGLAYGNGVLVTGARFAQRSFDLGDTWEELGDIGIDNWAMRQVGYMPSLSSFYMVSDTDVVFSDDTAETWTHPTTLPASCIDGASQVAHHDGSVLLVHGDGRTCLSTDGAADVFVEGTVGTLRMYEQIEQVLHDGTTFVAFSRERMFTSADGVTWADVDVDVAGPGVLGPIARNPSTGRYVSASGGWTQWYDDQRFFSSADGVTWTTLAPEAVSGGHPMREFAVGVLRHGCR